MNEKTYRYWFIYLIPEVLQEKYIENIALYPKGAAILYGYTDKKELIQLWKSQRNKKIFRIKKEMISRGQVNYFADTYPDHYLELVEGKTRVSDGEIRQFKLAVTRTERIQTEMDLSFMIHTYLRRSYQTFPPYVYSRIFQSALTTLLYGAILYPHPEISDDSYEMMEEYDFLYQFVKKYQPLLN